MKKQLNKINNSKGGYRLKNISILGATGSIGTQTLDVLRKEKDRFTLLGISAHLNRDKVLEIIEEFKPQFVAITDKGTYKLLKDYCRINYPSVEVLFGIEGMQIVATLDKVDIVVTSVVGMIGLIPTIAAIRAGKDIALANKETLVAAGEIVMREAKLHGVKILPVDSEHSAIYQCIQGNNMSNIHRILLTASGGPFKGKTLMELENVTLKDALKHPKWNMGKKISIDSATLMNKGLEVIEAHWLFNVDYTNIEAVVHPQSIIHSMVEYIDGSVIAQLGCADMRLPIQYALNYPHRAERVVEYLNIYGTEALSFEKPDLETFKCLQLAFEAGKIGGNMTAILNSANEAAVELFMVERIKFLKIPEIVEESMNRFDHNSKAADSNAAIEEIIDIDRKVKEFIMSKY